MKLSALVESLGVSEVHHIAPPCPECGPSGPGVPLAAYRLAEGETAESLRCAACGLIWRGELNEVRAAWIGRLNFEMQEDWEIEQELKGPITVGSIVEVGGALYVAQTTAHDFGGAVGTAFRGKPVTGSDPYGRLLVDRDSVALRAVEYKIVSRDQAARRFGWYG